MPHDPVKDPYIAVRVLVKELSKDRTLRARIKELRWKRVRSGDNEVNVNLDDDSTNLPAPSVDPGLEGNFWPGQSSLISVKAPSDGAGNF